MQLMRGQISCNILVIFLWILLPGTFSATSTKLIKDGGTIESEGRIFELGFFSPGSSNHRYIGIWYQKIPIQSVVWVANAENPLTDLSGSFSIGDDGNLFVFDGQGSAIWSTNVSIASNFTTAVLRDNGNLVLRDGISGRLLWQSFDHPSNTLLPGMKVSLKLGTGERRMLRSWKSDSDPSPGNFTFGIDQGHSHQIFIWKGSVPYWRSGSWNLRAINRVPEANKHFMFHFILRLVQDEIHFEYSGMYDHTRLVMEASGHIKCQVWERESKSWVLAWFQPQDRCNLYAACGAFSVCNNIESTPKCKCMVGFEEANSKNWSVGCVRKEELQCGDRDRFVSMGNIKVPDGESIAAAVSAKECKDLCISNCSCNAYAYANMSFWGEPACLVWHGRLVDAGELSLGSDEELTDFYIRVASSRSSLNQSISIYVIIGLCFLAVLLLVGVMVCYFKMFKCKGNREKMLNMSIFSSITSEDIFEASGTEKHDVPVFGFRNIATATNDFSISNMLGEGGFGVVYKGVMPGGRQIAVKRLSYDSAQGLEEFKNEVVLIAKLQHRNLVHLLGFCIEGVEKILVYEYMPNKSLDFFLFDETQKNLLDWEKRFDIILGIARGLLYLHQDSRVKIVHRDLKASNILLDEHMKPKISDFGLARIFDRNQTQADTRRVVGTYGYMPPEYAIKGRFSVKSDVFSFGVIILEILSGKKNGRFCEDEDSLSLLGRAWRLWDEDRVIDFIDPSLDVSSNIQEVMKCIQVGLLCVQEDPRMRPAMASVVNYLDDSASIPMPEQPSLNRSSRLKPHSDDEVTISLLGF